MSKTKLEASVKLDLAGRPFWVIKHPWGELRELRPGGMLTLSPKDYPEGSSVVVSEPATCGECQTLRTSRGEEPGWVYESAGPDSRWVRCKKCVGFADRREN